MKDVYGGKRHGTYRKNLNQDKLLINKNTEKGLEKVKSESLKEIIFKDLLSSRFSNGLMND